jgi:glucose/arabinose dehydrogenase
VSGVPAVFSDGQGGLLDVTIHPEFEQNRLVYLSYAHGTNEANRLRVARAELRENVLQNLEVIFEVVETKSGNQHFGSRFAWLPDNTLLFSVGDGGNPPTEYNGELIREQAQNLNAHLGKVIRINDDGSIPNDNPFVGRPDVNPEIFSYGHRNVQGITYDAARNRVVASEHGSLGGDELNSIQAGENYGWPIVTYGTEYDAFRTEIGEGRSLPDFSDPLVAWTPTVAPSSVVAYSGNQYGATGDMFMAAMLLRNNATLAAYVTRPAGAIIRLLTDDAGNIESQELIRLGDVRVRSIVQGSDGYLYALTDTTDRQSRPGTNAGAIVRVESF